ncbi:MAG: ribosome silencing factor [Candidatus Cloacimonetes bacterium]|jgi:ribosome-associated protein|nr:ribosome silencing factor [Candidatus Cloacimonadota bacterium]MCK9334182.1 ribosome silencing factor [Candidatus Cloacimonadota bacterium]MDD2683073.1 ribosome silencing factor [Candidatus Cloacimonadota bacterium]MDD3096818.1 ribosome silencing factor [Candidatus Cloacimonadota bacterium]MDD3577385.1 ribosome silencing factor [Candidatus Cloacimonadota bacterium]
MKPTSNDIVEEILQDNIKYQAIIEWLKEKKAENIRSYEVQGKTDYTDVIVVCEGNADLHNKAIASHLIDMAKENHLSVLSKEGVENAQWILIDLGDVIVHIFLPQTRDYYKIDDLFEKVKTRNPDEDKQ